MEVNKTQTLEPSSSSKTEMQHEEIESEKHPIPDSDIFLSDTSCSDLENFSDSDCDDHQHDKPFKRFKLENEKKLYEKDYFIEELSKGVNSDTATDIIYRQNKTRLQKSLRTIIETLDAPRGHINVTKNKNNFLNMYEKCIENNVRMKKISTSSKAKITGI